jgi:hypothetical protein
MALDFPGSDAGALLAPRKRGLQPLNGAYAAWALDQSNGSVKADRSGNGRDADGLLSGSPSRIPSPVAGRYAYHNTGQAGTASGPVLVPYDTLSPVYLASTGFTFCFWFCLTGIIDNGYNEAWSLCWCSDNQCWIPWVMDYKSGSDPSLLISYADGGTTKTGTGLHHTLGQWQYCQLSVSLAGHLIVGTDDSYFEADGIGMHPPPKQYPMGIGGSTFGTAFARFMAGAYFDVLVADRALSLAELKIQHASVK